MPSDYRFWSAVDAALDGTSATTGDESPLVNLDDLQHDRRVPVAMSLLADASSSSFTLSESFNEALFLYITASIGVVLNAAVVACILTSRSQRRITSSFVVHGCALDAVKCAYCVPFATSLLRDVAPGFCAALGG
jgi:hypothetical protein